MGVPQSSSLAGESLSLTVVALSLEGRVAATIGGQQPSGWATAELTPTQVVHFCFIFSCLQAGPGGIQLSLLLPCTPGWDQGWRGTDKT